MKKIFRQKNSVLLILAVLFSFASFSQNEKKAKALLDVVSKKMSAYENMTIEFSSSLVNEEAGIKEGDEAPITGKIILQKEKYYLDYLGNTFIFDSKNLYVINNEDKEVTISNGDIDEDDGFIYPSKLLTFYKEGYHFSWGSLMTEKGKKIQYVNLIPIDSTSDIKNVQLAVNTQTNHIFKLIQTGSNGAKTTLSITTFKSNQVVSDKLFSFDKEKYLQLDYIID
ncbi:MAG: outer membrane lipoprotein carrier protein LolA [Flavobacteriaceae bacterium]|nr:MAG: outer membrane lipoprotein carrier protein LolA [Flavobacteriaceae bacterium]